MKDTNIIELNKSKFDIDTFTFKNLNSNFLCNISDTISVLSTAYTFENFYKKLTDNKIIFFHHI